VLGHVIFRCQFKSSGVNVILVLVR